MFTRLHSSRLYTQNHAACITFIYFFFRFQFNILIFKVSITSLSRWIPSMHHCWFIKIKICLDQFNILWFFRFVAKSIMKAVLRNKKSVCIPKVLYGLAGIKSILPPKAFTLLADFILQPTIPVLEHRSAIKLKKTASNAF